MSGTRSTVVYQQDGGRITYDRYRLLVEEGPDRGMERVLIDQPVVLGRGSKVDFPLADEGVSRSHAVLQPSGEGWRIKDLGSQAGTFVNGIRVDAAPLPPDCEIRLGETLLRLRVRKTVVRASLPTAEEFHGLLGGSPAMRLLFGLIEKVGALDLPVLLHGESGTGKESLARAVHEHSGVAAGPFEVVDCTLLERDHLRSELFGHVKGAFTGADQDRKGAFELADGGTVFLDEVGELPLEIQPALLRILEEGEVRPLGSSKVVRVRTRAVSATNRNLPAMVEAGQFRADLYYRFSALTVDVPPLRDRAGDLSRLAAHFLPPDFELSEAAMAAMEAHPWPGNVRELRNVLQRAAALAASPRLQPHDLRLEATGGALAGAPTSGSATLQEVSDRMLLETIELCAGNRKDAAKQLGIARSTLYRRLKKLGIE